MSTSNAAPVTSAHDGHRWSELRAWPLHKRQVWALVIGATALLALWSVAGLLFVHLLDDGPVGDADRAGAEWFEDRRTPTWNTISHYGSMLSETFVKVVLVALVGGAMVLIWRRWHEALFLAIAVIMEATVFVIASFIIDRDRPPVHQLDPAAPSGSFPSGHAAAAVAFYGSLFVIACWHTSNRAVRSIFGAIAVVAPVVVAVSRVARGMHHPFDVVAGVLLGLATVMLVRAVFAGVSPGPPLAGRTRSRSSLSS